MIKYNILKFSTTRATLNVLKNWRLSVKFQELSDSGEVTSFSAHPTFSI